MASPLESLIATTITTAFTDIFFDATLTQASTVYNCKAIFDKWQKFSIGVAHVSSYQVLILAKSLAVDPLIDDIVTLQDTAVEIASDLESKPAVEIDPARAVWTVRARPIEINPRIISIHRPGTIAAPGSTNVAVLVTPYSGQTIAAETSLYTGIKASIKYHSRGMRGTDPLPADVQRPGDWIVSIPLAANIPSGAICENDIVIDNTTPAARRYQVEAAYTHTIGWTLYCRFLKA